MRGPPSNSHYLIITFTAFTMSFTTGNSNLTPACFFPQVTSTHRHTQYTLDHAVGTIPQVENCSFDKAFGSNGQYPNPPEVCYDGIWFRRIDVLIGLFRSSIVCWRERFKWGRLHKTFDVGIKICYANVLMTTVFGDGAFSLQRSYI